MDLTWTVSCPEGVSVRAGGGDLEVSGPGGRLVLRSVPPAVLGALAGLAYPGRPLGEVVAGVAGGHARLFYHLRDLGRRGCLRLAVVDGGRRLATAVPVSWWFALPSADSTDRRRVLSRFACVRRVGGELVVESPLATVRIHLHDASLAAVLATLATPARSEELSGRLPAWPPGVVSSLVGLLCGTGMLTSVGEEGQTEEDSNASLRSWEFHDLLFHTRSREGRHDAPVGTTYHLAGELPPPAAVKPAVGGAVIELYRPDPDQLKRHDPPFCEVVEQRHSAREYGSPLTMEQLGEFLFRVARVKECFDVDVDTPAGERRMAMTTRPYPAAGGLYEIELYPVVNCCGGLERGLYHYDALHHRLERVSAANDLVEQLLAGAATAAGIVGQAQVLLVLSARFGRLSWKYSSIAYALTLKNVGVLYQSMYLTATAMGLAPCAIGAGDADVFARAIGSDYCAETSVGEFLLGGASR